MPIDPETPTIAETDLAETLGLDRALLREKRALELQEGQHWLLKKSTVHYPGWGVRELCRRLDVEPPAAWGGTQPPLPPAEKTPEKKDAGGVVSVTVTRRAQRNAHIVFAKKDGGPELPVRVRNAQAVGIGDELRVEIVQNLAVLSGPQPRPTRRRIAPRPAPAKP